MSELYACPCCGRIPKIEYACGEYFIVGAGISCPVCDAFDEMHSSETYETESWNRRVEDGKV